MFHNSPKSTPFPVPATSFEFSRVASANDEINQPHVVFKNNYGELNVPVDRFLSGDYAAWKDKSVLSTHQVERAAAAVVTLGL